MKLGILGTGKIAKEVLGIWQELDIESLSLLARPQSRDKAEKLAELYNVSHIYYDYDKMLESDIDTIYVALPNHIHTEYGKKAIEAGKNVIMEKPFAPEAGQLEELKRLADERKVYIVEAVSTFYLPAYISLKEVIDKIGRIKLVDMNFSQYSSRYDDFKKGKISPVFDAGKHGGALMDINVYNINLITDLFGMPDRVLYRANTEKGVDVSGILFMDYDDMKVSAIGAKDCANQNGSIIQGEKGSIWIKESVNKMTGFSISYNDGSKEEFDFREDRHRLCYEFEVFMDKIKKKDKDFFDEAYRRSHMTAKVLDMARK